MKGELPGRVTNEKVLCSSRKEAFIIDPITTKRTFVIGGLAKCVVPVDCRYTDGNYFVVQVKGPFIFYRSRQNLHCFKYMRSKKAK